MSTQQVLVIDDEVNVLRLCERVLDREGFQVRGTPSAEEGLHLLGEERWDLALVDIRLSDGDGLDLLAKMRQSGLETPVILITGHATMQVVIDALQSGAQDFVLKPFTPQELVASVHGVLDRERLRRENVRLRARIPILEISKVLMSETDPARLTHLALERVQRHLRADRVSLMLLDEERGDLYVSAARGMGTTPATDSRISVGEGVAGLVVQRRAPLLVPAPDLSPDQPGLDVRTMGLCLGTGSAISVPLLLQNRVLGVLNVCRIQGTDPFRQDDVDLLCILCGQIAVALENARLFERAQQEVAERKRAEDALEKGRSFVSAILDTVGALVVVLDREGRIVFFNQACEKTTGYAPAEVSGRYVWEPFLVPEEVEPVKAVFRELQSGHFPNQHENYWVTKDGTRRLIAWTNTVLLDGQGAVEYVIGTGVDVTERKQAEIERDATLEALRKGEERYRRMFQAASVSLWEEDISELRDALDSLRSHGVTDLGQYLDEHPDFVQGAARMIKVLDVNDITLQMHGAETKGQLLGTLDRTLVPEAVPALKQEILAIAEGRPYFEKESYARTLQGKMLDILVRIAIPQASAGASTMLVSIMDVTERKRAESTLRRERDLVARIAETSPVGIVMVDPGGQITFANPSAERVLGLAKDEIAQRAYNAPEWRITDYDGGPFPDEELPYSLIMETGQPVFDVRHAIEWPDGRRILLSISATPLRDESGGLAGMVATIDDVTDRVRMSRAVQESEARYRTISELTSDYAFSFCVEPDGSVTREWMTEAFTRITGYAREEMDPHDAWTDLVHPDDRPAFLQFTEELLAGRPQESEHRITTKDGAVRWMRACARPVWDQAGERLVRIYGAVQDITERRQAENALRQSLQTAVDIMQSIPSGLFIYQYGPPNDLVLLDGNPAAERLTGIKISEWRGREFNEIWPQARAAGLTASFLDVMQTGEFFLAEDLHYRDEHLEGAFRIRAFPMPGDRLGVAFENITERKRAQEALRESEARYRELFEEAPLCIFELDLIQDPPVIVRANRQATRVYGWSRQEFASVLPDMIIPPVAVSDLARIVDSLRAGQALTVESVNRRRDGTLFPVRISAAAETKTDPSRIILLIEDITIEQERRSEEEAIAGERQRIAREIHDGLAQDLASLRVRAGLWHDLVDHDPEQMHAELDAMESLLRRNIRDVRRSIFALRPLSMDELGFYPAIQRFAREFGEQGQLHIDLQVVGPQLRLPSHLEPVIFRIIQEALNNVGKHAQASAVWVELNLERPADAIRLTIRDDGVGFDPQTLDRAVQCGHVGLTHMRERVAKIGGTLDIESQVGQGTAIRVSLPIDKPHGGQ